MNEYKRTARMTGVLFIIATLAPILTAPFLGFLGGGVLGETAPDFLGTLSESEVQVFVGMLLELVWVLAVVGIPVVLFPVLKKYSEALALAFYSLRFMEALSTVVSSVFLVALWKLSQEFVAAAGPDVGYYQTLGTLLLNLREGAFMLGSGLVWTLSAVVLNYVLLRSRLVPRWLSIWGLLGAALSLVTYSFQFFNVNLDILFLPIALQEMVFAVWLIVKGFDLSALAALSAKADADMA